MLKRTLVFSSPVVLSIKNQQIVLYYKDLPEEKRTIPIEDIGVVLIENPMISISIPLINALSDNNVALIFCDSRSMPNAMLMNLETNTMQGEVLRNQINIGEVLKKNLWKQIVEYKIRNQALLLEKLNIDASSLRPLYTNVKSGDNDNREGIAAKLYWPLLFGNEFIRDRSSGGINILLNYGYTILRAAVARALMGSGLLPAIGLFHHNRSNAFPLADDIMEPYRPFVDEIVYDLMKNGQISLEKNSKSRILSVLMCDTHFKNTIRPLSIALSITTASLVKCIAHEQKTISFPLIK
ncbi:MAG: type II CRISPR-associated endonuclease Cas1 [Bacteroidaceae bacterium]|nr:type II CRISPR-associated endonuclease Cas1 [Bacteroidaceae bacterium]